MNNFFFSISICTVSKMKQYCSYVPNIIAFRISHERGFLVCQIFDI